MIITYWIIISLIIVFAGCFVVFNYTQLLRKSKISCLFRSSLLRYLVKRILFSALILFCVITLVFFLIRILPKDYFYAFADVDIKYENYHSSNISNSNIFKQLLDFYYNILPFPKKVCTSTHLDYNGSFACSNYDYTIINLGTSYTYIKNIRVWDIIKEKCIVSFIVGFLAYLLQCLIGYPLGIYMARKENKAVDKSASLLHIFISIIPAIVYFYLFILLFMLVFKLPVNFEIDNALSYIAPLTALCFWGCFSVAHWVKKYIVIEMNNDYVSYARSKGLSEKYIFYKHVMRNALIPLVRTIPTNLVNCLCGFYLLEAAFAIPGIGLTLTMAINLQDVYLAQGLIIFFSFLSISAYLVGDLITVLIDKRVSLAKEKNV